MSGKFTCRDKTVGIQKDPIHYTAQMIELSIDKYHCSIIAWSLL